MANIPNTLPALTDSQEEFIIKAMALASTGDAAKALGLSAQTVLAYSRNPGVVRVMHERRERRIRTDLANKAMNTLADLMDATNPPAVRLKAATWALEAAGHVTQAEGGGEKPMEDMTADELAAFIAKADGAIHAKAEAARPVIQGVAQGNAD